METQLNSIPDPDQPPGHRKLPNEERENTLNLLLEGNYCDLFIFISRKDFNIFSSFKK